MRAREDVAMASLWVQEWYFGEKNFISDFSSSDFCRTYMCKTHKFEWNDKRRRCCKKKNSLDWFFILFSLQAISQTLKSINFSQKWRRNFTKKSTTINYRTTKVRTRKQRKKLAKSLKFLRKFFLLFSSPLLSLLEITILCALLCERSWDTCQSFCLGFTSHSVPWCGYGSNLWDFKQITIRQIYDCLLFELAQCKKTQSRRHLSLSEKCDLCGVYTFINITQTSFTVRFFRRFRIDFVYESVNNTMSICWGVRRGYRICSQCANKQKERQHMRESEDSDTPENAMPDWVCGFFLNFASSQANSKKFHAQSAILKEETSLFLFVLFSFCNRYSLPSPLRFQWLLSCTAWSQPRLSPPFPELRKSIKFFSNTKRSFGNFANIIWKT